MTQPQYLTSHTHTHHPLILLLHPNPADGHEVLLALVLLVLHALVLQALLPMCVSE